MQAVADMKGRQPSETKERAEASMRRVAPFFGNGGQFSQIFHAVIVGGDHPALVSGDQYDTYVMPLPE
jgi:hypothetical protein